MYKKAYWSDKRLDANVEYVIMGQQKNYNEFIMEVTFSQRETWLHWSSAGDLLAIVISSTVE